MRRHNRRIFRAARSILGSDDDAEDAMQEAYVSAYQHLRDFEGRAKFSTWLTRIAVHAALAKLRKSKRLTSLEALEEQGASLRGTLSGVEDQTGLGGLGGLSGVEGSAGIEAHAGGQPMTPSPEQAASDAELRAALEQAVDALPTSFRTVFVMRAVEELTVTETAEALDIPEETVRTRLHRARGLLRAELTRRLEATAPRAFEFHLSRCDRVVAAVFRRIAAQPAPGNRHPTP
ncbi:MAG: sigma-70 family RNA polymerase sigma factor [Deltaproteobacteria bacterium]|nr:sigma-70 family RNA polymerase sigma factor [Deltaproteobacteria bacterium]